MIFGKLLCLFTGHELGEPYMADDGLMYMNCIRCHLKTGMGRVMKYNPPADFGFSLEPDELGYQPYEDVHMMGKRTSNNPAIVERISYKDNNE